MNRKNKATERPHVVVIGGGFAGLTFCKRLRGNCRVTLIDKQNHHLFQPLLYQVATAGLSAAEIAQPLRSILQNRPNVTCIMDEVTAIDRSARSIHLADGDELHYNWLVFAAGGRTSYFGHDQWAGRTLGLKTIDDALALRRRILSSFERAEITDDQEQRRKLMTMVVVGGGPTGVELAGALAELAKVIFRRDFRRIDTAQAQVLLIEGSDGVLESFPRKLRDSAADQLRKLGVQVHLGHRVTAIENDQVRFGDRIVESANIFWTAGIEAVPLTAQLGGEQDRAGRVVVRSDLTLPDDDRVLVLGDAARVQRGDGSLVPGIAPAAIQMGKFAARLISARLRGELAPMNFVYRDKGIMATIGRKAAVARIGRWQLSGPPAWLGWLFIHLLFLIGLRSKIIVVTQWVWAYLRYQRGARIIFGQDSEKSSAS
ncbi:MAG: NAD(P)/FAD-dependent oxidoreductase [Phycisphaeraceae bacterium]|nr:NAD(P)/FAD-dependent oxidoreductase [Phycisphaeraceae bacterium]